MNRRSFLTGLGALIGGLALDQAITLGRVWSFPSKISIPQPIKIVTAAEGALHFRVGDLVSIPACSPYGRPTYFAGIARKIEQYIVTEIVDGDLKLTPANRLFGPA